MPTHFQLGALNKHTNEYEYPAIASKLKFYKCPDCDRDVIFKKGTINRPHFAHKKSDSPCNYYDKPNESQIHKDAKNLLYTILKNKIEFDITRRCAHCDAIYYISGEHKGNTITHHYYENGKPEIEFSFKYRHSNKRADVALVFDSICQYDTHFFEICYKNKTQSCNRPEPWFEFDALTLINDINDQINTDFPIVLTCIRRVFDDIQCGCYKERERLENEKIMEKIQKEKEQKQKKRDEDERWKEIIRLSKLRDEEDRQKKEQEQNKLKQKQEEIKRKKEEEIINEKNRRDAIIERIRNKHPNLLKPKS
jgi:hypothetical protein